MDSVVSAPDAKPVNAVAGGVDLHHELDRLRFQLAVEKGMKPNEEQSMVALKTESIMSNSVLKAISEACPLDAEALANVEGMNSVKVDKLGTYIVDICKRFSGQQKRCAEEDDKENELPNPKRLALAVSTEKAASPAQQERIEREQLNAEQQKFAAAALAGQNLFITGEAGTGKSFMLNYVIQELKDTNKVVAVTATTGLAAAALGGGTIHAFAGVGLAKEPPKNIIGRVMGTSTTVKRWRDTEVLIIDEISMMDAGLFSLLDEVGRAARNLNRPFGGLQLVLCGDFLQLPPVETSGFAFESKVWAEAGLQTAELTTAVRQQGDKAFLEILSEVRIGLCSPASAKKLAACNADSKPLPKDGIPPTRLYCTNRDVDAENNSRLAELPGDVEEATARDTWVEECGNKQGILDLMDKKCRSVLQLKIGAQVIITQNRPKEGIVNGTRGVVENWASSFLGMPVPVVRCDNGSVVTIEPIVHKQAGPNSVGTLSRLQLPLKLGWALTVHRAQGCTLSRAELQLENAFAHGQTYVALSRVISLDGLWIRGRQVTQKEVKASPSVLDFYFSSE